MKIMIIYVFYINATTNCWNRVQKKQKFIHQMIRYFYKKLTAKMSNGDSSGNQDGWLCLEQSFKIYTLQNSMNSFSEGFLRFYKTLDFSFLEAKYYKVINFTGITRILGSKLIFKSLNQLTKWFFSHFMHFQKLAQS